MSVGFPPETPPRARLGEYLFPGLLALFCVLAGTMPYLYAYWTAPAGEVFMGFVGRGTPGANGYFMLARQAQEGYHLMENLATPEPLPRNYFNFEWWLTGKASAWTGLSPEAVFHVDRILSVFGFALAAYYLASLSIASVFWRRIAVSIICLGSGFGWLIVLANGLGLDLEISRDLKGVQVFGYLVNKPHFIRAGIFAMLTYGFVVEGLRRKQLRWFLLSGFAALCHSSIRPYHIIELHVIYAAIPIMLAWRDQDWRLRRFLPFVAAGAVHAPAVAYYMLYMYLGSLGMSGWKRVPGFLLEYVLWLSWPFLVLVATIPFFLRLRGQRIDVLMLSTWIVTAWLICNLYPYWGAGQEAAFYAFHIVPAILVLAGPMLWVANWLHGFPAIAARWKASYRLPVALALVALSLPSSAYVYRDMFTSLHRDHPHWTFYLPESVYDALHWIEAELPSNNVILASHDTSQFIPRFSHNKVVTGHDMLTANYDEKNWIVARFYGQAGDLDFKWQTVRRFNVGYVVEGPLERKLGVARLAEIPWLEAVYQQGDVTIYRVASAPIRRAEP